MPPGDDRHGLIHGELVRVLGAAYVSDDPVLLEAYTREAQTPAAETRGKPEFVVLPGSTEDVQRVTRLSHSLKFPWSAASTGFLYRYTAAIRPYWCYVDLKRMNHWEVDARNGFAVVEPGVTFSQLSAEAMKAGWWLPHPRDGAHFSVLANYCFGGSHVTAYRTGRSREHLLGIEWVLPNGEVLRAGSLGFGFGGYGWRDGPGPDLKGAGTPLGHVGSLGLITRVGVRLFPWPGPACLPTVGSGLERKLALPADRFRGFLINYPTIAQAVEAMVEIGKAEIGVLVEHWPANCLARRMARSNQDFWERWQGRYWQNRTANNVFVHVYGFTSAVQTRYEEKVLKQIAADTGGELVAGDVYEEAVGVMARNPYPARMLSFGTYIGAGGAMDSVDDIVPSFEAGKVLRRYSPPLLDYEEGDGVINVHNLGRFALSAPSGAYEKSDENDSKVAGLSGERTSGHAADASAVGPSRTVVIAARIKKALDPDNVANPTRFINVENMTMPPVNT